MMGSSIVSFGLQHCTRHLLASKEQRLSEGGQYRAAVLWEMCSVSTVGVWELLESTGVLRRYYCFSRTAVGRVVCAPVLFDLLSICPWNTTLEVLVPLCIVLSEFHVWFWVSFQELLPSCLLQVPGRSLCGGHLSLSNMWLWCESYRSHSTSFVKSWRGLGSFQTWTHLSHLRIWNEFIVFFVVFCLFCFSMILGIYVCQWKTKQNKFGLFLNVDFGKLTVVMEKSRQ